MITIKILTGSVRPTRFNMQPAQWIANLAKETHPEVRFELVDIAKMNLPFLDEPKTPSENEYTKDYTKKWSAIINEADGFIFVTPEYNHSVSPALKNAIDYLFYEWNYKPVSYVSYGSLAGGARAVEHMRGIAAELRMYDLREQILLPSYWEHLNEKGEYLFTEGQAKTAKVMLKDLVFWANNMKEARAQLKAK